MARKRTPEAVVQTAIPTIDEQATQASIASISDARPIAFTESTLGRARMTSSLSTEEVSAHVDLLNDIVPTAKHEPRDKVVQDLHEARFIAWQMGLTWQEIGDAEQCPWLTVRRSIWYYLYRMPLLEQIQARNAHSMARAHNEHSDEYFTQLGILLKEKNWAARSSALKHYRHTVGLQGQSTVTVNVDNRKQTAVLAKGSGSFEAAMDRVRRQHAEDREDERAQLTEGAPIEGEIVNDNGL